MGNELAGESRGKCVTSVFTVFFEDPFWVGVLEEDYDGSRYMGRHVFGAEPSNPELLQFYIYEFDRISKIKISGENVKTKSIGFKKSVHKSKQAQNKTGIGTKSQNLFQQSLQEAMEARKKEKKAEAIAGKEEKYKKKQEKKAEKKKGH
jgi:hypothetical protein